MRRITTFRSTTDRIYDGGPIRIYYYTECPTRYRTRHFFNNFVTNEDVATKYVADLPHCVRNVTT